MTQNNIIQPTEFKVSYTNHSPQQGQIISPLWFSFHDGSYDYFNEGETASLALEYMAEDGEVGNPHNRITPEFMEVLIADGLDITKVPAAESTLSGDFAASDAASNGGYQDIIFTNDAATFAHPVPGDTESISFELNIDDTNHHYFSYATMPFPTNDAFIGNDDPTEVALFDEQGHFIGANFEVWGSDVWDAGTEVNDETVETLPYNGHQMFVGGVDEHGVIHRHPGLLPKGADGAVDFEIEGEKIFANSDFSQPGYHFLNIQVSALYQGTEDDDHIIGSLGDDEIYGNQGNDRIYGDPLSDANYQYEVGGDDNIYGGEGSDRIWGRLGDDLIYGEAGNDEIYGGQGDDLLYGGEGSDKFYIAPETGYDVIKDFHIEQDYIGLAGDLSYEDLELTQLGTSTAISAGGEELAILVDTNAEQLTEAHFVLEDTF